MKEIQSLCFLYCHLGGEKSASAIAFLICVPVCCLVGYEFNGGKYFPTFYCAFQLYT